eukprot:CAMPEP_0197644698 /NCGR_PEP_ID=MMETSP1338-20131121/17584_1 /TAXON_ID=43686 ORGANISM="Pelagodinium beii, Strain RCC1491" /NCGR_SAMPLE_ID=MMETSP1338 /ASSEMBLY_ACC=CAM_ASM_000754 /LENGTH=733 /DNA_ID=CAMNT_0043218135 /DNA_START=73 /DNA_END=2274 /DNA_ORIENTATION=+
MSYPQSQFAAYSAAEYDSLLPQHVNLLDKVQSKDDFHSKRYRCLSEPEFAINTLGPYAVLEIGILSGKDLIEREAAMLKVIDTNPDSLVEVYVDDLQQENCKTPVARGKKDPVWQYQSAVDIVAPLSMLRLQVVDDRATEKAPIGFVEICVGDMPHDTVIEGWFELRFQENMVKNSMLRYAEHCKLREDERSVQEAEAQNAATAAQDETGQIAEAKKSFVKTVEKVETQKKRVNDAFQACVHSTADKASELGFETLSQSLKDRSGSTVRKNAGEIYLRLNLKQVVSSTTAKFALALDPHPAVSRGTPTEVEVAELIDLQYCVDEVFEFKVKLLDDAVFCFLYWVLYLLTWRSSLLSFIHLAIWLIVAWHTFLFSTLFPLLLILNLVVNYFPAARMPMTRGGLNAPFTEQGLAWVASWRSTDQMHTFVKRVATDDLKLSIGQNEQKLYFFAAKCARDGQPTVSLNELKIALRRAEFLAETEETEAPLQSGDLVWVDGRDRGKVVQVGAADVTVELKDIGRSMLTQTATLDKRRVTRRLVLDKEVSKAAGPLALRALQTLAKQLVDAIFPQLEVIKTAAVPAVELITDILIWKKSSVAAGICFALLLYSAAFAWAAIISLTEQEDEAGTMGAVAEVLVSVLRHIKNYILTLIFVGLLTFQAWWAAGVKSVIKILSRLGRKRPAPGNWAFFKEDTDWHNTLGNLAQKEQQEQGPGMFHLPYMTRDASTAYASAGGS